MVLLCMACGQRDDGARSEPPSRLVTHGGPHSGPPAHPPATLHLAADGIELVDRSTGAARRLSFGMPEAAARAAIEPTTGDQFERFTDSNCRSRPNSRLEYPGGLFLFFEAGRFVAWQQDDDGGGLYRMRNGIAPGMTREALRRFRPIEARRAANTDADMADFTAGPVSGMLLDGKVFNFSAGRHACLN